MEKNSDSDFAEMISKLNTSSIQVHIFHWQVKGQGSYAAHQAFGSYYEAIPGLIDGLVESYQGKYSILKGYKKYDIEDYKDTKTTINYLKDLYGKVEDLRDCCKDSYIQNQIDNVDQLIYSTLYLIKELS